MNDQYPYSYGDLPEAFCRYDSAGVVIVPVPYDGTSTWGKGSDRGPETVIEASGQMELYDLETDSEVYRVGIYTDEPLRVVAPGARGVEEMVQQVRLRVAGHLDKGKRVVVLGGEHSVSIGAIQATADRYDGMSVLQLDAHADLRDEYEGSRYNHACVMSRAKEVCPIVQVGVRSMDASEKDVIDWDDVFLAEEIQGRRGWKKAVIERLSEKVYVTVDVDVFDPSVMPGTGTPEPGGLGWYEVIGLLKKVSRKREIVGFDVVEVCPGEGDRVSPFTAAKLIYKMLSYIYKENE